MVSFTTAMVERKSNLGCPIGFGNGEPKHGQHFRMAHCFQDGNTEVDQQFGQGVSGLWYRSCGVQGPAHAPGAFMDARC